MAGGVSLGPFGGRSGAFAWTMRNAWPSMPGCNGWRTLSWVKPPSGPVPQACPSDFTGISPWAPMAADPRSGRRRSAIAPKLSIGAPPDPLGPQGQDWGLPPFNPLTLEEQGLAAFRDLVSANMRHAGAIRIDHAFQLQRLFLIPSGAPASQGAYVDYPFEAMLAVLRVESHRAHCLVIAEDLGTAPEGFSDAIMESGVLSYRVLPFEREKDRPSRSRTNIPARPWPSSPPTICRLSPAGGAASTSTCARRLASSIRPKLPTKAIARAADRQYLTKALAEEGLLPSSEDSGEAAA